jgi:hypothetical protein
MTRRILTFALFESQSILSEEQVKFLDKYTKGKWLLNPSNGLVDVDGDVYCENQKLENMKGVSFGRVRGNFSCSYNEITSLEGAPQEVGGSFSCSGNELISLEGAPQEVGGDFYCSGNELISLEGAPQKIGGNFLFNDINRYGELCIPGDEWGLDRLLLSHWMKNELIADLFDPELLNQQIAKDPAGMILKLKSIWNKEYFAEIRSNLVWPAGYEEQMGLSGDLGDVGF